MSFLPTAKGLGTSEAAVTRGSACLNIAPEYGSDKNYLQMEAFILNMLMYNLPTKGYCLTQWPVPRDALAPDEDSRQRGCLLSSSGANASRGNTSIGDAPFRLCPRFIKFGIEQTVSTTFVAASRNGGAVFERTIALLKQYNLEPNPD
ncbi:hypothetical protein NPIL_405981 [Nephila pilipes]|uniref:Uncharacterized protein n=1 Tax=Nephila pilipes TaxID=299642 RepID=A0A8X6TTR6_NEPPI|nr:hypothetical protein NPIL_405981 [Nephila pilipes]